VAVTCRQATEWAAPRLREVTPPRGAKGLGLVAAYDRGPIVGQACRAQRSHVAATLKRQRRRGKPGGKRKAGRSGRPPPRRRRTAPLELSKPQGQGRARLVDAGGLAGSTLGPPHVVRSRHGLAKPRPGRVPGAPARAAADVMRAHENRWALEPWPKDVQPWLGLGPHQSRSSGAAVTRRQRVGGAEALLPHRRLERTGAQGPQTRQQAAAVATAAAQDQLRGGRWADLRADLQAQGPEPSRLDEPERLRVA
jgi:hypothetical protein